MSTWTDEERTVVLDDDAMNTLTALVMLTGVDRNGVASNLVIVGAKETLRQAKLINEKRGDDT